MKAIVDAFCVLSCQIPNLSKSYICISPATPTRIKAQIKVLLDVNENNGSWRYLGVPLFKKSLNRQDCNFLPEKMITKIASWQRKALSLAGRATLLKFVLTTIPLYSLSCIHVPSYSLNNLEKEYRAFLWGHDSTQRGLHLLA